jgi:signal transduction histidine kinase
LQPTHLFFAGIAVSAAVASAALFAFTMWWVRRRERTYLAASIATAAAAVFGVAASIQYTLPAGAANLLAERVQFVALVVLAPGVLAFGLALGGNPRPRLQWTCRAVSCVFAGLVTFSDLVVSSELEARALAASTVEYDPRPGPLAAFFFVHILGCGIAGTVGVVRHARREGRLAWVIYLGIGVFVATAVNDALVKFHVLRSGYVFAEGLLGFAAAIACIAVGTHLRALEAAENASTNLAAAVEARTRQLREIQARLAQEHQLAALGRLSAGVAHEINNPLAAIQANLAFLSEALGSPAPSRQVAAALHESTEACRRVSQIVRDFASFSRRTRDAVARIALASPVSTAIRFLARAHPRAASVQASLDPDVHVVGDETRLGKVATNLLENALHAIEQRGDDAGEVRVEVCRRDRTAVLSVEDNGPGVPESVRDRIFDPFFTTKPAGRGIGLGLSICAKIVADLGGTIEVSTSRQGGARFEVRLPAAPSVAPEPHRAA